MKTNTKAEPKKILFQISLGNGLTNMISLGKIRPGFCTAAVKHELIHGKSWIEKVHERGNRYIPPTMVKELSVCLHFPASFSVLATVHATLTVNKFHQQIPLSSPHVDLFFIFPPAQLHLLNYLT